MELYEALNKVIACKGKDYVTNPKLINALIDYNAFERNRALKNIFRNIQSDGYIERLYLNGAWDINCEQMTYEIEQDFAFPSDLISYILKSVAFSLGYIDTIENEPPSKKESVLTEEFTSISGIPSLCLTHLTDFVYLRQDWCDASPAILQDLKVEINKLDLPYHNFALRSHLSDAYNFSFSCDILPKNNISGNIVFSVIGLSKTNKVLFHRLLSNKMTEHAHWKRTKVDYYTYDLTIGIDSETFVPFRSNDFTFFKGFGDNEVEKLILCVENGYNSFHYPTTMINSSQCHKGFYDAGFFGISAAVDPIDLTSALDFDDKYISISSYIQAMGNQSNVFLYFEVDNAGKDDESTPNHYPNFELQIYNKIGYLKQKEVLPLKGFYNCGNGEEHHYIISHEFRSLIPVEEISKIIIREK